MEGGAFFYDFCGVLSDDPLSGRATETKPFTFLERRRGREQVRGLTTEIRRGPASHDEIRRATTNHDEPRGATGGDAVALTP